MKVLLTGGAGYIGSHVAKALLEAGCTLAVVDDFSTGSRQAIPKLAAFGRGRFRFFELDICHRDSMSLVAQQFRPNAIVHLAGRKRVEESFSCPHSYHRCNVEGTASVLAAADSSGCGRMIYSSSAAVYGNSTAWPFREELEVSPVSPYGRTKVLAEQLVRGWSGAGREARTAVVLRYFNPCGHDLSLAGRNRSGGSGGNSLADRIARIAEGLETHLEIFGNTYATVDGTCRRDFIHIHDIANAHLSALGFARAAASSFEIFNLGNGMDTSVLEFIQIYGEATGIRIPFSYAPARKGDIAVSRACIEKAKSRMRWAPSYDIRDICTALRPREHHVGRPSHGMSGHSPASAGELVMG